VLAVGKVIFDISMSLDSFVTESGIRADEPMGPGGQKLHAWANESEDPRDRAELDVGGLGAMIAGRRTYHTSVPWWQSDGPTGKARVPLFVVTHAAPKSSPANGVYTFVTGGIVEALDQTRAVARDADISIMGGAGIGRQYIAAGLVDQLGIHLVPVLFGSGTKMFDGPLDRHVHLALVGSTSTTAASHLRYAVLKP
jgi:dihydrofolate reductase